uniref:Uncharacterized protein n=1 Tax=Oryza sativa subsp. japonica TaxID=39947 RepID=Q6ZBX5_ORYSJ|nr:hypothetical protein [Oryza sativa Japonica Group]
MQHQLQCSGEGAASPSASQSASQSGDDSRHRRHGNCPDAGGLDGDEQDGHRWRRARAGVLDARELAALTTAAWGMERGGREDDEGID